MKLLWVLTALCLPAAATDRAPAAIMKDMAGVYKQRFTSGLITPGKAPMEADQTYQAEDVIEIVPYDDTRMYFRARLQFYNGHVCSISGLARHQNGAFVFHAPDTAGMVDDCTLTIASSNDALTMTDRVSPDGPATCSAHCGARGSFSNVSMKNTTRRPIRYLDRILASPQYKEAQKND